MHLFLPYPVVCYNKVHLECGSSKKVVGGSYVIVHSKTNGNKPKVHIANEIITVNLGSIMEAKSTFTQLSTNKSVTSTFSEEATDLKTMIQQVLELFAVAQVATFLNKMCLWLIPLAINLCIGLCYISGHWIQHQGYCLFISPPTHWA